jgi:hypothetical protein
VNKAILFALIFVTIGIFVLGNAALLLFRESTLHRTAALGFPTIIILGVAGFTIGWKRRKGR